MKKLFLLLMILGYSVSTYAVKPSTKNIAVETIDYNFKTDTLGLEQDQVNGEGQKTFDPNKDRFRIAGVFSVVFGIAMVLGLLLLLIGGLALTTATIVGVYLVVGAIPLGFLAFIATTFFRRKIELTKKERKLWIAAIIFNAISVLILLGIGLIP